MEQNHHSSSHVLATTTPLLSPIEKQIQSKFIRSMPIRKLTPLDEMGRPISSFSTSPPSSSSYHYPQIPSYYSSSFSSSRRPSLKKTFLSLPVSDSTLEDEKEEKRREGENFFYPMTEKSGMMAGHCPICQKWCFYCTLLTLIILLLSLTVLFLLKRV